jgi:magnesium-transporting ATPase (P-type)
VFDGYAESSKRGKQPLDINNLMLRGSVLRKTEWVIGVALNVGIDSKIVKNMTKAPRKVSTARHVCMACFLACWQTAAPVPRGTSACFSQQLALCTSPTLAAGAYLWPGCPSTQACC